jgi:hypothetical protein
MAMLCKTSVARKLMMYAFSRGVRITSAQLHPIDAKAQFGAAVDACLLVLSFSRHQPPARQCQVFDQLGGTPTRSIGFEDGQLIADSCRTISDEMALRRETRLFGGDGT